ncbi:hypothetical protein Trydic_g12193 [Trypoxylus dichotomus]
MLIVLVLLSICTKLILSIDQETCLAEAEFEYCKADKSSSNLLWNLYTGHNLFFKIVLPENCLSYGFLYIWELKLLSTGKIIKTFDHFINRAVLTIRKDVISCNEYNLQVVIKGTRWNMRTLNCWFKINTAGPIPIIAGGQYRNAMSGDRIVLDGASTDEAGVPSLKYSWKCASNPSKPFCRDFASKEKQTYITVEGSPGSVFDITLTISAKDIVETTHQYIRIVSNSLPLVHISCEKNCLEKGHIETDPEVILFLKATCSKNCDSVSFLWSIPEDLEEETIFGLSDHRLVLLPGRLEADTVYEMKIEAIRDGIPTGAMAKWSLRTVSMPEQTCTVRPKSGKSITTVFSVDCVTSGHKRPAMYAVDQLYMGETIAGIFLARNMIPQLSVLLAPEAEVGQVIVYSRDDQYVYANALLNVTVKPLLAHLPGEDLIKEIVRIYNGRSELVPSVKTLAKHGWLERAVQIINCIIWEMEYIQPDSLRQEFSHKFKFKLLKDMLMFPSDSGIKGMLSLVPILIDYTKPKRVHYAVLLSKLCKRLSNTVKAFIVNSKFPMLKIKIAQEYTSILIDCADYLLDGKFERALGYDITTGFPIDMHQVIEEDYPSYKDIVDSQLREKFVDITNNAMEIIEICTDTFSLSLAYGEQVKIGSTTKIIMQLGTSSEIDHVIYSSPGVEIVLPKDLCFKKEDNMRLLFLSYDSNIYFWDSVGKNISTRIVELDIYDEKNNVIDRLPDYIDAYLDVVDNKTGVTPLSGKSEAWGDSSEWTEFDITVYRIDVRKQAKLFVEFEIPSGALQIVLTEGRRPSLDDFKKNAMMFSGVGRLQFPAANYSTWCYVGILPHKPAPRSVDISPVVSALKSAWGLVNPLRSKETVNFNYMFRTQSCLEWSGGKWTTKDCQLGKYTTTTRVHCRCTGLTAVAGITHIPHSKLDDIIPGTYQLKFVYTYFIFLMTAGIVLCYLIAMCFVSIRALSNTIYLYFLGDNIKDERYAYLVIVQTGKRNNTGTSSNVAIKLIGDKGASKAHVLNYPDPNRKLLQQVGEDWFVLTTSLHLGELTSICLWYDALGNRPTWYCHSVRICDLQLEKWWSFSVHRWFTVTDCNQHYHEIPINDPAEDRKKKRYVNYFGFHFGGDHTWNLFSSGNDIRFGYLERLTVVLSNILLTYSLGLLICVTPEMRLRDGFHNPLFNSYLRIFACALGISILSSSCNTFFVFCFRNSTRKREAFAYTKSLLTSSGITLTWLILGGTVLLEIVYLSAFGFWTSRISCKVWFTMTTISILISVFIWENIYISLTIIFEKQMAKTRLVTKYDYQAIVYETEQQRKALYEITGFYGLRPYLTHLYKPLDEETCQRRKEKLLDRMLLSVTLRDMLLFALYLLCLFILAYENMDHMTVFHNNHIRDMMEADDGDPALDEIRSLEDIYSYLNDTLVPTIHGANWYGDWNVIDPGLMADFNTKVLGVARIRQKRVRANSCALTAFARSLNFTRCDPELTTNAADKRSSVGKTIWTYWQPAQTGLTVTYGQIRSYSGGGYVSTLARKLENAYYVIEHLQLDKWIDSLTRVLFVEFWTYNANRNLFNAVKVVIEISATRFIPTSAEIYTSRLIHVDISSELIPVIVFTVLLIIVFYQICNCMARLVQKRLKFFKGFWNVVDLIILTLSISMIVLSALKAEFVGHVLDKLEHTKKNKFINYYNVVYYDKLLTLMYALLICIATLRIWKYLRFGVMFKVFERTLITQLKPITGVLVYNVAILTMFSLAGFIIFSSFSENFRTLEETFTCMTLISLNFDMENFDFETLEQYAPIEGYIFYTVFTLAMLMIVNVYITVIIIYYEESLKYYIEKELKYSVLDYAKDEFYYLTRYFARYLRSLRLKGGQEATRKVHPNTHRYLDAHVIDDWILCKMAAIATGISQNYLNRRDVHHVLKAKDFEIMFRIAYYTVKPQRQSRKHIFFMGQGQDRPKFVPDERLLEMESIVRRILEKDESITTKTDKKESYAIDRLTLKKLENMNKFLNMVNRFVGNIQFVSTRKS